MSVFKTIPVLFSFSIIFLYSCQREVTEQGSNNTLIQTAGTDPVFLIIDEESIDNGNEPNNFSDVNVNDQLARVGLRKPLDYFQKNIGKEVVLYPGQVGDEGWHALKTIPSSWINAGPTAIGARNYLEAGPGLGSGNPDDGKEVLLDQIPDVTPLRATGLSMLKGKTVLAVVYDGDVSINYSPLLGNLMGANLGIVSFDVVEITERRDGSTSSLPKVTIRIRDANESARGLLMLFSNVPVPQSSSEPFDIKPPVAVPAIQLVQAP